MKTVGPPQKQIYTKGVRIIAVFMGLVSVVVLYGWVSNIQVLKSITPGLVAMNPLTAVCFMLAGIALWLATTATSHTKNMLVSKIGLLIAIVGSLVLLRYIFHIDTQIDRLLFTARLDAEALRPNRMAPNTAFNFLLMGIALGLVHSYKQRSWLKYLAIASLLSTGIALIGYLYGTPYLYGVGNFIPMALHTALLFVCFATGILLLLASYNS